MLSLGRTPSTVNYVYYRTCDLQILSFSLISLMLLCKAKSSLCWAKVFKYDKVQFHSFFFHYCSFHAKSKHSLLLLVLKIFFLFFFSWEILVFYVFGWSPCSPFHNFYEMYKVYGHAYLISCDVHLLWQHLLKNVFLVHWIIPWSLKRLIVLK